MPQYSISVVLGPLADAWVKVLGTTAVCIAVSITCSVENQGPGIEPRDRPRVLTSDETSWLKLDVVLHFAAPVLVALGIFWSFGTLEASLGAMTVRFQ